MAHDENKGKFGHVFYNHQLTDQEISNYELKFIGVFA